LYISVINCINTNTSSKLTEKRHSFYFIELGTSCLFLVCGQGNITPSQ
jgi:hypothetical protein